MRPISGVVLDGGVIRCENGLIIKTALPKGTRRYDEVWVYFDYTRNKVVKIQPITEPEEEVPYCEPKEESVFHDECEEAPPH